MKKVSIIYWSGTGNTEIMAKAIADGAKIDEVEVSLLSVSEASADDVKNSDVVALGCPSMGAEVLEEAEMEPFVESIESVVKGKKLALFGSYGWGDGEWMRNWVERMESCGAQLIDDEGLMANYEPDEEVLGNCKELGERLASA
ncbi:flavodoxin [Clostridium ganghwense]|uniref:Flavodoxin n=1 Tax=Clostridium ganghwense TaxID=312089 RepID=A0ABT4CNG9_9CLOT|nr:flavodoxin [Clostridium ganghwense]MCY6369616.1 flavodoxin [Clostridium ganghwense]